MTVLFVTGVTGFVGRYAALRLLDRPDKPTLRCLVRADREEEGHKRLLDSLRKAAPDDVVAAVADRIEAVPGDLLEPRLGLGETAWRDVAEGVDAVLHAAADIRFDRDLAESRRYNVEGTREVIDLARAAADGGTLKRFDWVGTAFVAGLRRDLVAEDDLEHDQGWKNPYEQSKYEAELLVRTEAADLPWTILRPSIVVGDSRTGTTSNFGMLYWPVQLYARGWWRTIVGRPDTPVDIVPVDFVADALEALCRCDAPTRKTYHLASGPDGALTIADFADLAQRSFGGPAPRYVDPEFFLRWVRPMVDLVLWGKKRRVIREGGRFFVPYFQGNPRFCTQVARAALEPLGLRPPMVRTYVDTLFDYCKRTDFGRNVAES